MRAARFILPPDNPRLEARAFTTLAPPGTAVIYTSPSGSKVEARVEEPAYVEGGHVVVYIDVCRDPVGIQSVWIPAETMKKNAEKALKAAGRR